MNWTPVIYSYAVTFLAEVSSQYTQLKGYLQLIKIHNMTDCDDNTKWNKVLEETELKSIHNK
jgi:hypothetical protein